LDLFGSLLLTGDERALRSDAINEQANLAKQAVAIADQERLARQQAEAIADQANLAKQQAEQKAARLAEKLRALGIDPEF